MPVPLPLSVEASTGRNIRPAHTLLGSVVATLGGYEVGVVAASGVNVHLSNLEGWWDLPGSTGGVEQRTSAHGGWTSQAFYQPRGITLAARLRGSSFAQVSRELEGLLAAVPINDLTPLFVEEIDGRVLFANVRQADDPLVSRSGVGAEANISLVAPDPRRYDVALVTASTGLPLTSGGLRLPFRLPVRVAGGVQLGLMTVTNDGNLDTPPVFTVVGPCPPFTLTHRGTSKTLRYHEAVPAGRTVVIDTATQTALLDGVAPRYVTGSWFTYAPGRNEVAFTADTYDADASVVSQHRNAWK